MGVLRSLVTVHKLLVYCGTKRIWVHYGYGCTMDMGVLWIWVYCGYGCTVGQNGYGCTVGQSEIRVKCLSSPVLSGLRRT